MKIGVGLLLALVYLSGISSVIKKSVGYVEHIFRQAQDDEYELGVLHYHLFIVVVHGYVFGVRLLAHLQRQLARR